MNNNPSSEEFFTHLTFIVNAAVIYGIGLFSGVFGEFIFSAIACLIMSFVLMIFIAPVFIIEAFLFKNLFGLFTKDKDFV